MRSKELYDLIDGIAPFALSREYIARGAYDNSGLLLDSGEEISGVLFALDLSSAAAEEAIKRGANCIVTHHPAIWEGLKRVDGPVLACARAGISVISAHLNLDAAKGGIDECLMEGLGGSAPLAVMEQLSAGGYGRVYDVKREPLSAFVSRAKRTFRTERIVTYGGGEVARAASFCGAGFTEGAIAFAEEHGADTLVSSDGKHHLVAACVERGLNVVLLTHYAAEFYGFSRFAETVKSEIGGTPCAVFTDERLL